MTALSNVNPLRKEVDKKYSVPCPFNLSYKLLKRDDREKKKGESKKRRKKDE